MFIDAAAAAVGDLARSHLKGYDGLSSATQTLQLRVEELSVLSDREYSHSDYFLILVTCDLLVIFRQNVET